jgi:hypothetical protein
MYSSTCFGRPYAQHQELNNCSNSLWFHHWSVVVAVLLIVVWPVITGQQRCYHHAPTVKPEAVNAVVSSWWWAWRRPKTFWATLKRQVINLWKYCIYFLMIGCPCIVVHITLVWSPTWRTKDSYLFTYNTFIKTPLHVSITILLIFYNYDVYLLKMSRVMLEKCRGFLTKVLYVNK